MKKSLVTHVVVMVVAIVLGSYLASSLTSQRVDMIKGEAQISKAPIGGFNKFASDVQWMLFINYCGGLTSIQKDNVDEVYKRLDGILSNDPNHRDAYELGGMLFSVREPQKAVEIFTRGTNNPNLKNNWKLPFYAGFVMTQHMTDEDDPDRLKKAEDMFRESLARNSSMPQVFSSLVRTRGKRILKRKSWKGIPVVNDKHAYLCALFDEWHIGSDSEGGDLALGEVSENSEGNVDLRPRIITAAQKAKTSAPTNKHVLKTIDIVLGKVLKDGHLCSKCLTHYAPGDKFCSACGATVEVYGICRKCKTVKKGKFCTACGSK